MQFHSAVTDIPSSIDAIEQLIADVRASRIQTDAAFLFFSGHHAPDAQNIAERLWLELDPQSVIGCSSEGVIGGAREIERRPAMALLVGQLPGVRIHPFHIPTERWAQLLQDDDDIRDIVGYGPETRAMIGLGDPFTTPITQWMEKLDVVCPTAPLIGGMASSARSRGENILIRNDETFTEGFVGISLSGDIEVETIVSQGARPIGKAYVITKAHENVIDQLGGKPALAILKEVVDALTDQERELLRHGMLIGRAVSEYRDAFTHGDFLIRNIVGIDQEEGAIGVGDYVRVGQTVQFHARDAATASDDLTKLLSGQSKHPAAGGLLFSCNGRGSHMFEESDHDIGKIRAASTGTQVAGFFAAGEFGPVGKKNFIHGHTASIALFRKKSEKA